jgi:hypothetical protein
MAGATEHSRQVDAIAWALFFIWIGVALLAGISWAWSLLGIGVIILGAQAMLYLSGDKVDGFWVACGLVFLAAGFWELIGLTWQLAPILLVLVGLVMLGNALFGTRARTPRT